MQGSDRVLLAIKIVEQRFDFSSKLLFLTMQHFRITSTSDVNVPDSPVSNNGHMRHTRPLEGFLHFAGGVYQDWDVPASLITEGSDHLRIFLNIDEIREEYKSAKDLCRAERTHSGNFT